MADTKLNGCVVYKCKLIKECNERYAGENPPCAAEALKPSHNSIKAKIADYTKEVMDKIDDAKERGAVNDLSVIAYALVNKLISATSAV